MKKAIMLLGLLLSVAMMAQEQSTVTVKSSEVNNGVVIITVHQANPVQEGKASFVLQCNKGGHLCAIPEPGQYIMVRLPKNWGMYDCVNVDLYPATGNPASSTQIGEYCLTEK